MFPTRRPSPVGLVMFVLSLKKGRYAYQFGQFAWTHMILLVIFVPSSFFVSNIFEGLIWFLLPCFLIIGNDIMAYLAGGRNHCISFLFNAICRLVVLVVRSLATACSFRLVSGSPGRQ